MFNSPYITCHVANWSLKYVVPAHGKKLSASALHRAIKQMKADGTIAKLEFLDALTGQTFNVLEAAEHGARSLTVRYNQNRDFAVVKL